MKILNAIFSGKPAQNGFKLKFIKSENVWHVLRGHAIMYIGSKDKCLKYIEHAGA